ncbi:mycofactocin system transcriptional regulator [Thermocatellispora tengchongensis]|uniref:mycofactocin system transcriptional regulator n=1 Tax=Thermocatellispora tengchongensis TaxID=1073253 RepID=UPI0016169F39|nr:mycofactocin system transcriptional regulator [Thermocatellispora tengchongensis]
MNAGQTRGRRPTTDHAAIERAAFRLFAERGFEETTVDAIAEAAGIARRTLFRYYPSKNDIPWGRFEAGLAHLREFLRAMPHDIPVWRAVHRAVLDFNRLDEAAVPQHRERMRLLLTTPALQAHSALKYAAWRRVIAEYVAVRRGLSPDDLLPRTVGHVSLGMALSAYEQWLDSEDLSLSELLDSALSGLRLYLCEDHDGRHPAAGGG